MSENETLHIYILYAVLFILYIIFTYILRVHICVLACTSKAFKCIHLYINMGFSGGSDSKESACNVGDQGSIAGSGRSPEEANGNPL